MVAKAVREVIRHPLFNSVLFDIDSYDGLTGVSNFQTSISNPQTLDFQIYAWTEGTGPENVHPRASDSWFLALVPIWLDKVDNKPNPSTMYCSVKE